MRFCTDSVTPPSGTSTVRTPSPLSIWPGSAKRTTAPPLALVVSGRRATSRPSRRTEAMADCPAMGSPVGRDSSSVAATSSPGPYAFRSSSSFFFMRGGSYDCTMTFFSSLAPLAVRARTTYSPPAAPAGMTKSLLARPSAACTRFVATTAPRGSTSW
ncbi:MAG: hypothetical protein U1F43_28770 [Myxococcota bacterium]